MRTAIAALLLLNVITAAARQQNILENIPPTAIYVETAYAGNEHKDGCDWYLPVSDISDTDFTNASLFGRNCIINIRLRGIINSEGAALFARLVERLEKSGHSPASITLNSKGGDADAAIAIAAIVRDSPLFLSPAGGVETRIADDHSAVCFSACVVIFAAGYRRTLEFNIDNNPDLSSRLGIHAPGHFDEKTGAYDTSNSNVQLLRIKRALKRYFSSISVAEEFVDDMFAVPFDNIRLLGEADLAGYGIAVNQAD
jgi:hypothetical protein